ncbi:hypothetical protein C8R44DRAFT_974771 [Mycena epipterygia]|nr:hypothetical protein C8R44DRAFT_974771 [Mycena epipterygia]
MTIVGETVDAVKVTILVVNIFSAMAPRKQLAKGSDALDKAARLLNNKAIPKEERERFAQRSSDLRRTQQLLATQTSQKTTIRKKFERIQKAKDFANESERLAAEAWEASKGSFIDKVNARVLDPERSHGRPIPTPSTFTRSYDETSSFFSNDADAFDVDVETREVSLGHIDLGSMDNGRSFSDDVLKQMSFGGPEFSV